MPKTLCKRCIECRMLIWFLKKVWKRAAKQVYRQPNYCRRCWDDRGAW
jgi:hypothetical protein